MGRFERKRRGVSAKALALVLVVVLLFGSEACWLFVKVDESANLDDFITYEMADGWTELEAGVYYREVPAAAADVTFPVLKGSQVAVRGTVTKEMLTAESFTSPTLSFTAYAVQKDNVATAAEAWAKAPNT